MSPADTTLALSGGEDARLVGHRHPGHAKPLVDFLRGQTPGAIQGGGCLQRRTRIIAPGFEVDPNPWGSRTEQADIREVHDPVVLAFALERTPLYVSNGNGEVGPLDDADAEFDDLEAWRSEMNDAFVARLQELDIPVTMA